MHTSIFEALMMLGFGVAWPFNILRSIRSKTAAGKSFAFAFTLEFAYICGVIHKILYSFDIVFWLYLLDAVLVLIDIILMFRNQRLDKFRALRAQVRQRRRASPKMVKYK